jgi:hypothetical protein
MLKTILSVFAAMFGVQSSKNSERDLQSGKFKEFIFAGILGLLAFIFTVYLVVKLVLIKNGL